MLVEGKLLVGLVLQVDLQDPICTFRWVLVQVDLVIQDNGYQGLKMGSILYDNTLSNLHRKETVLTAPLSSKLEQGLNNLDKVQQGDINYINIEFNGETAGLTKQDVIDGVVEAMERKQRDKDKRLGR